MKLIAGSGSGADQNFIFRGGCPAKVWSRAA